MSQQGREMPNSGQIWSFLGKKFFFLLEKSKVCYPHNGKPTWAPCSHWSFVGEWTTCAKKGTIWPKMTKNAYFGSILDVFGPKILIFMGVSKSFGTHIMEKPPRQLVRIVFWSGIRSNGPKMPIFGPKCQFWAKFGRFWAQNPIFWGQGVKILVPSYRDSNETPFSC